MVRLFALRWWLVALGAMAGAAVSLWVRAPDSPETPRLVLLYLPCTVNVRYLEPYNPAVAFTPHLQAFARDAIVFRRHQTEAGQSGVAYASILSGRQAPGHGVFKNPSSLPDAVDLIAEVFRRHGYETFFWPGHRMASPELNFGQGVDASHTYWDPKGITNLRRELFLKAADPRFERILERLAADPTYRALVLTNFTVTHNLYNDAHLDRFCAAVPAECEGFSAADLARYTALFTANVFDLMLDFRAVVARLRLPVEEVARLVRVAEILYASNVHYLDRLFGDLVARVRAHGLWETSLIVFTADHGELLHRDNAPFSWWHGFALAPEVLHVPWLVRAPGVQAGSYEGVSRSTDVLPTIAGLVSAPLTDEGVTGADLAPVLRGETAPLDLLAFSHAALFPEGQRPLLTRFPRVAPLVAHRPDDLSVAVRDGDLVHKLVRTDGAFVPAVYDWRTDPEERTNLYDAHDARHRAMVERLRAYKEVLVQSHARWHAEEPALPRAREQELLRSLGYLE